MLALMRSLAGERQGLEEGGGGEPPKKGGLFEWEQEEQKLATISGGVGGADRGWSFSHPSKGGVKKTRKSK